MNTDPAKLFQLIQLFHLKVMPEEKVHVRIVHESYTFIILLYLVQVNKEVV